MSMYTLFLTEITQIEDFSFVNIAAVLGGRLCIQPGPWATILVPTVCGLIVFAVGWILTRYFKKLDDKKNRFAYRSLVIDWVKLIEHSADQFIQSINNIADSIGQSDNMQPEPFSVPQAIPYRLNELPLEILTDAFLRGKKGNERKRSNVHFFNIVSGFEYLSKMSEQVQSYYERYNKQALDLCKEWNENYTQFVDALNSSQSLNAYKTMKDSWDAAFLETRDSMKVHHDHLSSFVDLADSLKDRDIISYVNRLSLIIEQRKALNVGFAQLFESLAEATRESYSAMREAAEFFKS